MSNNKNKNNKNNNNKNMQYTAKPNTTPVGPVTTIRSEPTPKQSERLDVASSQLKALNAEYGPAPTEGIAEQAGPTLEESLKKVELLLVGARSHFDKARQLEESNKAEEKRLSAQKRDQEAELLQKKADAYAEIETNKKVVAAEHVKKKLEIDQTEFDLLARIESVDKRETTLAERESVCRATEATFAEQRARLVERELNAENGFLTEKVRIFKLVEDEVNQLREERDHLRNEIGHARAEANEEIALIREKIEDEMRSKAKARAEKWAEEDIARTKAQAEVRRRFDEEMVRERQQGLDALRTLLASERERAEANWQSDFDRRTFGLDKREADLDKREEDLTERLKAHRAAQLDQQAAQELLSTDRAGLERKVDRLVAEHTEDLRHEVNSLQKQLEDAREKRDSYFHALEARREIDRRFGGRDPEEVLAALNAAEHDRDTLEQQLRERPDARAAERLSGLERERSNWLEERSALLGDLAKANGELATRRLAAIELEALRKQKEALEIHKQLLDGAVDELRARVDELTRQEDLRNPMTALTSLDEKEDFQVEKQTIAPLGRATPTLKEFANDLRHRIAAGVEGRTLYYAERDVRAFLGGLAMTRLMLLQGISGTGKTSLPLAFASAVGGGIEIIEVQAGWRDRQDLVGYYNAFHRHYYATNFLQALYKAGTPAYRDRLFMIVLDEINLSRPEQFFADFLSALEQPMEKRRITLVNDPVTQAPRLMQEGRHLPIPPNVWFVGTANHDESTAEFADKTYDRAHIMEMPRNTGESHFDVHKYNSRNPLSYEKLEDVFNKAISKQAKSTEKATAWLRKAPFANDLQNRFRVGWGNRLENQLTRYLPVVVEAGGSVGEAMDHLLVTKVLRKLKDRHDVRATALEEVSTKLQKAWEELDNANPPERCVALIEHEINAKKGEELA